MATLRREWVSVEQAQQWLDTYDPKWSSQQVMEAMAQELRAGKKRRWYGAIIINQETHVCVEGLMQLLAIVKRQHGAMCWIARANDCHFSEGQLERTAHGDQVVFRKMDTVETTPLVLPAMRIEDEDLPPHLRRRPGP